MRPQGPATIHLPQRPSRPLRTLAQRLAVAVGLLSFVAALTWLERRGFRDVDDTSVSLLDAIYYATVSITTTGYGDITPVTDEARLVNILLVTPARVLFLILLVGTTLEVLAEGSRRAFRERIWRKGLRDHIIVCGYGVKARSALAVLLAKGATNDQVVVIDPRASAIAEANASGLTALEGDATRKKVLEEAGIRDAASVIVAPDRDDASVLITLTARELNPTATIAASVRDEENRHLLTQSGADSVITSSGAAGRLLGFAISEPNVVNVLEDLLSVGQGLDLIEREVTDEQVGPLAQLPGNTPVLAVARDGQRLRFDDPRAQQLQRGDRVVCLCANPGQPGEATT